MRLHSGQGLYRIGTRSIRDRLVGRMFCSALGAAASPGSFSPAHAATPDETLQLIR
jgi:hypothetical protein